MEKSVFKYILKYSTPQQIYLTVLAFISLPFLYAYYDLPKYIINEILQSPIADYELPVLNIPFEKIPYLFLMCGIFLILILINQAFKYIINVYRGITGERMLRRLRYDLYHRILRFPQPTFRKTDQGEVIAMITQEVEPLGGFIAEAYSLIAFQGGQLLVILSFLLIQNWIMALAAIALYPVQFYLIPKLQRRVNLLGKERVLRVRKLSARIGETVQGIREIHTNDTSNFELAEFSSQLGAIYNVRYRIYIEKFIIKFLNNTIQQLGPFFFYSIGGYLVVQGELEIGTLVAAIAAHKDLGAPWKELLSWYQRKEDARIKYDQVVAKFALAGLLDEELLHDKADKPAELKGPVAFNNVTLTDDQGTNLIDALSTNIPFDKRVAIVGSGGAGKDEFTQLLARLLLPDRGSIMIGAADLSRLPESVIGRRISYVSTAPFIFNTSIGENLRYGLKHRMMTPVTYAGEELVTWERFVKEAEASGNAVDDVNADWVNAPMIQAETPEAMRLATLEVLETTGLAEDVYTFGLRGKIDPAERQDLADAVLQARGRLQQRLKEPDIAPLVEIFDRNTYNLNASVAENLLFGHPTDKVFDVERLAQNRYVNETLDKVGLSEQFLQVGFQVASTMVELFADLPPDHELFQQFSFISAEELPDAQALLQRADRGNLMALDEIDRTYLMSLPFKLIPARHRLGLIDETFQEKILEARRIFAENLPADLQGSMDFFEVERYSAAANLQDNILFGKVSYGQAQAQDRVGALIREVVDELELRDTVVEVGLNFECGIAGSRLSGGQRQKLALARALLKKPDLLILAEATAPLDTDSQNHIHARLLESFKGRGLIWTVHRRSMAEAFDHIIVLRQGRVVESGTFEELNQPGSQFDALSD